MLRWLSVGSKQARNGDQVRDAEGTRKAVREEVPQLREALPLITAEFERARRYERCLTVAVLAVADAAVGPAERRPPASVLASVVREAIRETDLVARDASARRCIVVMPEIGAEEGRRAVARMCEICAERLSCDVGADIAVFPQDGWRFLDLVEVAQRQAATQAGPTLAVPARNTI